MGHPFRAWRQKKQEKRLTKALSSAIKIWTCDWYDDVIVFIARMYLALSRQCIYFLVSRWSVISTVTYRSLLVHDLARPEGATIRHRSVTRSHSPGGAAASRPVDWTFSRASCCSLQVIVLTHNTDEIYPLSCTLKIDLSESMFSYSLVFVPFIHPLTRSVIK